MLRWRAGLCSFLSTGVVLWIFHDGLSGYVIDERVNVNVNKTLPAAARRDVSSLPRTAQLSYKIPSFRYILRFPEAVSRLFLSLSLSFLSFTQYKSQC